MEMPWNGMYVPQLDVPMDLNEDGILDVAFYQVLPPAPRPSGVTYINVAASVGGLPNSLRLSEDTKGELIWLGNIPRKWAEKNYLYPVPQPDLTVNPALGQNPGWQ